MQKTPSTYPLALGTERPELAGYNPARYISSGSQRTAMKGTYGEVRQHSFICRRHAPAEPLPCISCRVNEIPA
jgi:hypothetical protein